MQTADRTAVAEGLDYVAVWNSGFLQSDDLHRSTDGFHGKTGAEVHRGLISGPSDARSKRSAPPAPPEASGGRAHFRRSSAAWRRSASARSFWRHAFTMSSAPVQDLRDARRIALRLVFDRAARSGCRGPNRRQRSGARTWGSSRGNARVLRERDRAHRTAPPRPTHTSGSGSACIPLASARAQSLHHREPASSHHRKIFRIRTCARGGAGLGRRRTQPTDPSICSSIRRLHSTAYSIGSVRVIGSMKPFTTMPIAWLSESPRLIR